MQSFPSLPAAVDPEATTTRSAHFEMRYDDLTQDGHIKLPALQLVLGRVCFEKIWSHHPLFNTRRHGILPILSRLVLEADAVPVSFTAPLEGRGGVELAHERGADGNVSALFMNAYGEIWGVRSRRAGSSSHSHDHAHGSANRDAPSEPRKRDARAPHEAVRLGRAFGEHVFTRPFGPPAERKMLAFDVAGQPAVPNALHTRSSTQLLTALPEGAQPLDADFTPDAAPWTFGLTHTDANQHVNSLVYARFFEEAALRRFAELGRNMRLLGRRIELNYRKPCFSGDRMICMLRSYVHDNELVATGYLIPEGGSKARAHCSFKLQLRSVPV